MVQYRPYPVVGVISPWNFPLALALGDAIPALQAGAAVVVKPSEFTPLGIAEIVRAWREEIGGPDVFDCVHGTGEAGGALVDNADFVQFTGSDRTGRKVMARAAETLTPVSLELGGKDPMIVLDDADIDRAANAATWGSMFNSGQVCLSVERIYVEEPVYDEFVAKLTKEVSALRQGADGRTPAKDVGAMTSPNQRGDGRRARDRGRSSKGAQGADRRQGRRGAGRLLRADGAGRRRPLDEGDARRDLRPGGRGDEGARRRGGAAPRQRHPLRPGRVGLRREAAGRAGSGGGSKCGAVNVNDVIVNYVLMDVPMGGWKESGVGFRHGEYGIKKYCRPESVIVHRFGGKREPVWYPYTRSRRGLIGRISRAFNARDWRRRLGLRAR